MATTDAAVPVNGNFAHQGFETVANNYAAASANSTNAYGASQQQSVANPASNNNTSEIPKDEVGWYFVEQYYTTLSKSPDRLYLFYNKRSQFVSGTEEDKIQVCVGQKAINDRIKDLDYHDTKVRVTNVDSQGSDANIVIQVIGEISNKGQPHKRFVQTFVLAEQTNGYFVLNDIFRYLAEEPDEEEELQHEPAPPSSGIQEPAPSATVPKAEALNQSDEIAKSEQDLQKVDHKLEEVVNEAPVREEPAPAAVNGTPIPEAAEVAVAEEAPAAAVSNPEEVLTKEPKVPAMEEALEPEKPKEPSPTPVAASEKPTTAAPAAPPKPAAPRTWAIMAASAHKVVTPVVPAAVAPAAVAAPQILSQPKAAAPASAPAQQTFATPPTQSSPAREPSPANIQGETSGWQTATGHKKEQSRSQNQAPTSESENKRAYIKNVYSQVEENSLRNVLSQFGEIHYLDINRQKNCAFVYFKNTAGYQDAVNNNPHHVNGVDLIVEERRVRPTSFAPRGRGGMGNQSPRGSFGPRGGFTPRGGRGGSVGRGGRPAQQEA